MVMFSFLSSEETLWQIRSVGEVYRSVESEKHEIKVFEVFTGYKLVLKVLLF